MTSDQHIAIASDHGGFDMKTELVPWLESQGYTVTDLGTDSPEAADYPDIGYKMAGVISKAKADTGILICGTGIGVSIAANRNESVRCALCYDETTARLARAHNDANVLALGARTLGIETAKDTIRRFLETDFDPKERYIRRRDKLGGAS